jgi:putative membrane protein
MQFLAQQWQPTTFPGLLGAAAIWAILGIFLLLAGFKIFDYITPNIHFGNELNKGNIAVAIVLASFFLCVAIIIAMAIR